MNPDKNNFKRLLFFALSSGVSIVAAGAVPDLSNIHF